MRRATKQYRKIDTETLDAWKRELSVASKPDRYRARVEEIHQTIGAETFFNQGGIEFLRDAWVASLVAIALAAETVRLWEGERPDFEAVIDGKARRFEVTEADMPGRRRGDEYRGSLGGTEDDPVSEWRRRFDAIDPSVRAVVEKKLTKEYGSDVSLVVLVNLGCYRAYLDEGVPVLSAATAAAKDKFQEVFALWEGYLFSFWKDGRRNGERWSTGEEP
jgi:hypothetical protein